MILSCSTAMYCERPGGKVLPVSKSFPVLRRAGFVNLDMSFYEYSYEGGVFPSDEWERWAEQLVCLKEELGLNFYQCHAYTYDFLAPQYQDGEKKSLQEMLVQRSLEVCSRLGCKVIVTHPSTAPAEDDAERIRLSEEKNREYFSHYMERADRLGMKTAVENMFGFHQKSGRLFPTQPEEMADFIDQMKDERIGVCWDFEHGAILGIDPKRVMEILGGRVLATHISDTTSGTNEQYMHVLPYAGLTDWSAVVKALKSAGYEGAFSLETHNFAKRLPDELIPAGLHFAWETGNYLIGLEG